MDGHAQIFADRTDAGRELARAVAKRKLPQPVTVLALPRGGVPVAYEIARALHAPLDVMVVRKIGMPGQPELAIGAIAAGDIIVREPDSQYRYAGLHLPFEHLARQERRELERRERKYREGLPPLDVRGRSVVLVDDGLATGATMIAALRATRKAGATSILVAAPVASDEASALVGGEADDLAILKTPAYLSSIGEWYERFDQVGDEEVCRLLALARMELPSQRHSRRYAHESV
jgi:putative phosphoribosyl transferase